MTYIQMEQSARGQTEDVLASVRAASEKKTTQRREMLDTRLGDAAKLRLQAAEIRQHTLDHLPHYLRQAEERLTANGIHVHWAADADEALRIFASITFSWKPRASPTSSPAVWAMPSMIRLGGNTPGLPP